METIQIQEIKPEFYKNFGKLKNWEVTKIKKGEAVKAHSHNFNAMYFVNGVKAIYGNGKKIELPEFATVFIPKLQEHAWSGVRENQTVAEVGHFHSGHGVHKIVNEY